MKLEQEHAEYYSKYSLVTFNPEMSYADAMKKGRAQDNMLLDIVSNVAEIDELNTEELVGKLLS